MQKKIPYTTKQERLRIIEENSSLLLIEEQNLETGNFLVFSDTYPEKDIVYISLPEEAFIKQQELITKTEEIEALWLYDSMIKDLAIEESNAMQADLMYQLMLKGVV